MLIDLPTELSVDLGWRVGDVLRVEIADDGLKIKRAMTAHDHAMKIARTCMEKYRDAFAFLAKH